MKAGTWLTAVATILGVSINNILRFWGESGFWVRFFFVVALLAGIILAVIDIQTWWKNRAKRHKSEKSVNDYLFRLLKRGGSATIFANHLSWVRNAPKVREFLRTEAGQGRDIRVFVPLHNDLTRELSNEGVRVKTYQSLEYEPESRFTLLNPGEPGSSVLAIGKGAFPNFYIEELSDDSHARVIAVVRDLLRILERVSDREDA